MLYLYHAQIRLFQELGISIKYLKISTLKISVWGFLGKNSYIVANSYVKDWPHWKTVIYLTSTQEFLETGMVQGTFLWPVH